MLLGLGPRSEYVAVAANRATAPAPAVLDSLLEAPGGCGVAAGAGLFACGRGALAASPLVGAATAALAVAGVVPDGDCAALRAHGLFAQLVPFAFPTALGALQSACAAARDPPPPGCPDHPRDHAYGRVFHTEMPP